MSELKFEVGDVWETLVDNVAGKPKGCYFYIHSLDRDGNVLDGYNDRVFLSRIARGHVKLISRKGENMNNTFTKDMLVAGKHVVEDRDGDKFVVMGDFLSGVREYSELCEYTHDLLNQDTDFPQLDIMKVYEINTQGTLSRIIAEANLVWQRQEKSPAQLKLEELEAKQREIADQMEQLRKSL